MKLCLNDLKEKDAWEAAGIAIPGYDPAAVAERTKKEPLWIHFGAGNIFRIFIGGLADRLLAEGALNRGIICAETFDYDIIDKIYDPYDNLALAVTLLADGTMKKKVLGSLSEAIRADSADERAWKRLKEIFTKPGLQMASFTITEKGYALKGADGAWLPFIKADLENGPQRPVGAIAVFCALLYERKLDNSFFSGSLKSQCKSSSTNSFIVYANHVNPTNATQICFVIIVIAIVISNALYPNLV